MNTLRVDENGELFARGRKPQRSPTFLGPRWAGVPEYQQRAKRSRERSPQAGPKTVGNAPQDEDALRSSDIADQEVGDDLLVEFFTIGRMILSNHQDMVRQQPWPDDLNDIPRVDQMYGPIPILDDEEVLPPPAKLPEAIERIKQMKVCGSAAAHWLLQAAYDLGSTSQLCHLVNGLFARYYCEDGSIIYLRREFDAYRSGSGQALHNVLEELRVPHHTRETPSWTW